MCVCVCVCVRARALSDGDSEFLKHSYTLLLVLLPGEPEVVLVLHDVCKHSPSQENHVLTSRRVLDADLKFLQEKTSQVGFRI